MSNRLNQEKQEKEAPRRMEYAEDQITTLGYEIDMKTNTSLMFKFKGENVVIYPYSGWFTGKSVTDGRGIANLLKQIK